ncbi:MAG TPA: hypothetical protein VJH23_00890 [archaeon]|nr:hypothetical protein [archaeon]
MPHIDAHIFNKKGMKKTIELFFDEDDNILEGVKSAMQEHNVSEVNVEEADGVLKELTVNYFERSSYQSKVSRDSRVMRVSGNFKLSYGELYGKMNVFTFDKPPIQGTVVRAKAKAGFSLKLSFVELVDSK